MNIAAKKSETAKKRCASSHLTLIKKDFLKHKYLYFMALPVFLFYLIFHYFPMYGTIIAFKNFSPALGVFNSPWASSGGLAHFINFISGPFFWRLLRNTLLISAYDIIFTFPTAIIFAILLNEVRCNPFKRVVQTVTYLPHFISMVVVCGLINVFVNSDGFINDLIVLFGGERSYLLANPKMFRPIYIASNIWHQFGWNSIVYIAALTNVDREQYEAAKIDGAGIIRQMISVTLPGIMPTIVTMFILRMGQVLMVGYEKVILLYNSATLETADVISSFVYRQGLEASDYSYSTAVNLMNSVVNFLMVFLTNTISRKVSETSLW